MSSQYYFSPNDSRSYQSTASFNRVQQYSNPSPKPQVRASVRVLGSQDQYQLSNSPRIVQVSPQQHHFQFDSRQQAGRPTGPAVVYQTPGAAQFTHRNVDLWTEGSSPYHQPQIQQYHSQPQDHYVHAQRVSVRSVSTGSPQQSHSVSPQRPPIPPVPHQQVFPIEDDYQPVGIRNLMNKFDSPTPRQPARSRSTSSRQTTTRSYQTYSALPKSHEPPVNSVEYYQMLQQNGISFNNLQQAIAPAHIQTTGLGMLRDRFKTGSLSDEFSRSIPVQRQPAHVSGGTGNSLSSIRNQYMTQTKEINLPPQPVQNIPRTIVGEDYPPKQQQQEVVVAAEVPEKQDETQTQQQEQQPDADNDGISSF